MADQIELSTFIQNLRRELTDAIAIGTGEEYRFIAKDIEVEMQIEAERKNDGSGKLSFKIFGIGIDGGGGLARENSSVQKIKLSLALVDRAGASPLISAPASAADV